MNATWKMAREVHVSADQELQQALARLEAVLLATRTAESELTDQLTRTIGYAELLSRDPALPGHLREAARQAADGAAAAAEILIRLRHETSSQESEWCPRSDPTAQP